jgi:hypothetical protein
MLSKRHLYRSPRISPAHWRGRPPDGQVIADHHVVEDARPALGIIRSRTTAASS